MTDENTYNLAVIIGWEKSLSAYITGTGAKGILDRTGGYGDLKVPLVLSWLRHENRFILGKEAMGILPEEGVKVEGLLKRCQDGVTLSISGKQYSADGLLGIYLEHLMAAVYDMNPNGLIRCAALMFPDDLEDSVADRVTLALEERLECHVVRVRREALARKRMSHKGHKQSPLWLDFSDDRMVLYEYVGEGLSPEPIKVLDKPIGLATLKEAFEQKLTDSFTTYRQVGAVSLEDAAFIRELAGNQLHNLMIRRREGKGLRLTFNQVFPPFQVTLDVPAIQSMTEPVIQNIEELCYRIRTGWSDYVLDVTGDVVRHGWVVKALVDTDTEIHEEDWTGAVFGLLAFSEEKKKNQGSPLPYDIGFFMEHQREPHVLFKAGMSLAGSPKALDVIVTKDNPQIVLWQHKEGLWQSLIEKRAELGDRTMAIFRVKVAAKGTDGIEMTFEELPI